MSPSEEENPPAVLQPHPGGRPWKVGPLLNLLALFGLTLLAAALLAPNFIRARSRQDPHTACKSNLKNIATALEMYSTDWNGDYPTSLTPLTPNYLKTIPECPTAATTTYAVAFGKYAPYNTHGYEQYYYLECHGENHLARHTTANFPAYNGIQGLIERAP